MRKLIKKIRFMFIIAFRKRGKRFTINSAFVDSHKFFNMSGKHVFFGYYDLPQINAGGSRLLVNVADKNANPAEDKAEIGFYDVTDGKYQRVGFTSAWCWQQGSRLRWHPHDEDVLLYNDVDDGRYVTKAADSVTGEARVIAPALYDISYDFKFGVSINFARLQRLRPGYGYCTLADLTECSPAPEDDGVFLVDLSDGSARLAVSLHELSRCSDEDLRYEHYINHISFCPSERKFIFFHIMKSAKKGFNRIIRLYLYNIDTGSLELIEDEWMTSHYSWHSADNLLTTQKKDGKLVYSIYDFSINERRAIGYNDLNRDGHPSFFKDNNRFVADTYPDRDGYQKVFVFDMAHNEAEFLAEFYHKLPKSSDMRCDLHPRLWENDSRQVLTLDTTCSGGVRQVALLELKI